MRTYATMSPAVVRDYARAAAQKYDAAKCTVERSGLPARSSRAVDGPDRSEITRSRGESQTTGTERQAGPQTCAKHTKETSYVPPQGDRGSNTGVGPSGFG